MRAAASAGARCTVSPRAADADGRVGEHPQTLERRVAGRRRQLASAGPVRAHHELGAVDGRGGRHHLDGGGRRGTQRLQPGPTQLRRGALHRHDGRCGDLEQLAAATVEAAGGVHDGRRRARRR